MPAVARLLLCLALSPALAQALEAPQVQVETLAKTTSSWDGGTLPAYPTAQPEVTVLRLRIAPGARLPLHLHPVINVAYMLAGELTVHMDQGPTRHLKAGDALVELVDKLHYGENQGSVPAELVVVYAGVVGGKITVLAGQ